jgi:choline-phosphate cytidylyltransferase
MKKVITYGTYDLLHYGHINLLKRAKELGDYLIVGVTSDAFDKNRGKLNVHQSLVERIENVKSTGLADMIIVEEYEGQKISDIQKYGVDIFTVGSDWVGKFDYLSDYCEVIYLDRTQGVSSTELRASQNSVIRIGLIGLGNPVERFISEAKFVSGITVTAAYSESIEKSAYISDKYGLQKCDTIADLLTNVDAVYISTTIDKHFDYIMCALEAGCHVLCESPMFLSLEDANRAFKYADEHKLVIFEALKTMFYPAFEHLLLIIRSGMIGTVKDIEVSFSQQPENIAAISENKYNGSFYDQGSYVLFPIVKILGTEYSDVKLYSYQENQFDLFTKGIIKYPKAMGSFKSGKGVKTEGDLVVTGTNGYIYVPAPWWQTEYFEIRYEDLRKTKKYFYKCDGDGLRYEIIEFIKMMNSCCLDNYKYSRKELIAITKFIELFDTGKVEHI